VIEELIKTIAQHLDEANIPYMIIGGQAVLLYGSPRLTRDIDMTLGVDTDKFSSVERICQKSGLKILAQKPQDFATETKVLPAEDPELRIRVDFIFSFSSYEQQAIDRAKEVLMSDYPVKFASCEDVIIHKMVAARAIDHEDVENMLIKNKNSIDFEYLRKWLLEFGKISEYKGILEKFDSLLKLAT